MAPLSIAAQCTSYPAKAEAAAVNMMPTPRFKASFATVFNAPIVPFFTASPSFPPSVSPPRLSGVAFNTCKACAVSRHWYAMLLSSVVPAIVMKPASCS